MHVNINTTILKQLSIKQHLHSVDVGGLCHQTPAPRYRAEALGRGDQTNVFRAVSTNETMQMRLLIA